MWFDLNFHGDWIPFQIWSDQMPGWTSRSQNVTIRKYHQQKERFIKKRLLKPNKMFDSAATVYNNVITLCAFENDRCLWNAQFAYVFGMTKLIDYPSLTTVASHTHCATKQSHVHVPMYTFQWFLCVELNKALFLLFRFILSYSMCILYSVHGTTFKHIEPKQEKKKNETNVAQIHWHATNE